VNNAFSIRNGSLALGLLLTVGTPVCRANPGDLTVTTSWLANTLSRGNNFGDMSQRFTMDYYSDIAVSNDSFVLCASAYEEAYSGCISYRNGDLCPRDAPTMWANAVTVTDGYAFYAYVHGKAGLFLMRAKRVPGHATDGAGCQGAEVMQVSSDLTGGPITSLAVDEVRDRLYAAQPKAGRVLVFKASDLSPLPALDWDLPRASHLTVDGQGNVWVSQAAVKAGRTELTGTAFGSAPADADHGPEKALTGDRASTFVAASAGGYVGIDLGQPQLITAVHYFAAAGDWTGGRWQAANSQAGPWTDIATIDHAPANWLDETLNVEVSQPYRCYRFLASPTAKITASEIGVFGPSPLVPGRIIKFDPTGHELLEIPDLAEPGPIHFDAPRDRLIVADVGPNQQLVAYNQVETHPAVDTSFGSGGRLGARGGILAGAASEAGTVAPLRFDDIRGFGVDAKGNITVGNAGCIGLNQTRLETYAPDGHPLWALQGLAFEDAACPDPANENDVYNNGNRMHLDYSRLAGNEWSEVAETVNPVKYPQDPRLAPFGMQIYGVRRIDGQLFLITCPQSAVPLSFYRFNPATDGYSAIPCAMIAERRDPNYPPHQPPGIGAFLWIDKNRDADFQANEFEKLDAVTVLRPYVDDTGDIWYPERFDIQHLAVGKTLSPQGVPSWSFTGPANQIFPAPEPFQGGAGRIIATQYDVPSKALFCFGFNSANPMTQHINYPLGRVLARYTVQDGKLTLTNQVNLPYDVDLGAGPHDQAAVCSMAGDYLFVGWFKLATVRVYRKSDLSYVGTIDIGKQSCAPLFDGPPELIAFKRPLVNEYVLFYPQYTANGTTMVRWLPNVTAAPEPPGSFTATATPAPGTSVNLNWTASAGAEGYTIERMDHGDGGWGPWSRIGKVTGAGTASYTDPGLTVAQTYAYRVRAFNTVKGGGESDYTQTIYVTAGEVTAGVTAPTGSR